LKIEFRGAEAQALLGASSARQRMALVTSKRLAPKLIPAIVDEGKIAQASGDVGEEIVA
jgi:hypothetical protein